MGQTFSSWLNVFISRKEIDFRLMMIGLDSAGKTTILYKMKLNETVSAAPTIGFNLEELKVKNVKIKVWDLSG
jgi:GTPase SAR1 family protein